MKLTTKKNALRFVEPQMVVDYTRDGVLSARNASNQDDNNDSNDSSKLSTGVSGYSPRQIGANLSSIASSHSSSSDCNSSNVKPRAVGSSESTAEIQKVHSAAHHLDLARTPHPCTRFRAMAGTDLGNQSISKKENERSHVSPLKSFRSSSSGTQSAIRFPEKTNTSDQSIRVRDKQRPQTATNTINTLRRTRRNFATRKRTSLQNRSSTLSPPSYSRSTISSRAHSSGKKSSSHHSKTPSASRPRSSGKESSSYHSKPKLSHIRLPYHDRLSRRERLSRQSIELSRRIQHGKENAKEQKEKEERVLVFNVRKCVLVDLLQSLYDQPDDTILAIRVKKKELRTLSEHEALKERRRQRRQGE